MSGIVYERRVSGEIASVRLYLLSPSETEKERKRDRKEREERERVMKEKHAYDKFCRLYRREIDHKWKKDFTQIDSRDSLARGKM